MAAAVLLAYVPRLPSSYAPAGLGLTSGSIRITPATNRRLRAFAMTQIAFSFVLSVLSEGVLIVLIGIAAGAAGAYAFADLAGNYLESVRVPGVLTILGTAGVLVSAALVASLTPAARAAHVDVLQALRSE